MQDTSKFMSQLVFRINRNFALLDNKLQLQVHLKFQLVTDSQKYNLFSSQTLINFSLVLIFGT
jgi:hypothetical protein